MKGRMERGRKKQGLKFWNLQASFCISQAVHIISSSWLICTFENKLVE